jgi:hypothetical protein
MLSVKVLLMVFVTHTDGINPSVKLFNGVVKESSGEKLGESKYHLGSPVTEMSLCLNYQKMKLRRKRIISVVEEARKFW